MKTKNILIPTDFSLATLNCVSGFLDKNPGQKFRVTMVHFLQLSDSISELLMLSRRNRDYQHIGSEFEAEIDKLRKGYASQLESLHAEFFYGNTIAVFKNFLDHLEIDAILMLHGHTYAKLTENSVDPQLMVQRSGCLVHTISAPVKPVRVERAIRVSRQELVLL
ncbi:hypothetical protein HQ865_07705 [Mucilaginibacter mali]|uniref:Universal stress protein n=1 Tax=Mucilaginibacter mali TaxID=2740462 RepID=A0A7D4UJV0_9SPHI|nr:hypothetical protein [Mucilaginibacter mali]QKJ29642.1 hypothetical protein HQ865_07705 [Mucilaginibacter mali]